jgi:hypothetical protein
MGSTPRGCNGGDRRIGGCENTTFVSAHSMNSSRLLMIGDAKRSVPSDPEKKTQTPNPAQKYKVQIIAQRDPEPFSTP